MGKYNYSQVRSIRLIELATSFIIQHQHSTKTAPLDAAQSGGWVNTHPGSNIS